MKEVDEWKVEKMDKFEPNPNIWLWSYFLKKASVHVRFDRWIKWSRWQEFSVVCFCFRHSLEPNSCSCRVWALCQIECWLDRLGQKPATWGKQWTLCSCLERNRCHPSGKCNQLENEIKMKIDQINGLQCLHVHFLLCLCRQCQIRNLNLI